MLLFTFPENQLVIIFRFLYISILLCKMSQNDSLAVLVLKRLALINFKKLILKKQLNRFFSKNNKFQVLLVDFLR